tara:strand:+ start:338 stop:1279 length:942 start_codon:yes stop_codon:yes gene_type:complete
MIKNNINPIFQMCRVDHWFKNLFVLPGIILAILLTGKEINFLNFIHLCQNFLSICLIASANYLINEYLDAPYDRFHPVKKNRASVKKKVKFVNVISLYLFLTLLSFTISIKSELNFLAFLTLFLFLGILYNVKPFRLKDRSYLDILSESLNNPVRLLLGWSAVESNFLPPSSILLSYWMGGAFLMTIKRFAELRSVKKAILIKYRITFKYYTEKKLLLKSFFYALVSCFFLGVFLIKYRVEYIMLFPIVALLFTYYLNLGLKKTSIVQTPEKLFQSKTLLIIVLSLVLSFVLFTVVDINFLNILLEPVKYEIL